MAKTILETQKRRLSLAAGKLHVEPIHTGSSLVYERPETEKGKPKQPGNWMARRYIKETRKYKFKAIGPSDDFGIADNLTIFNYEQARELAKLAVKELAKEYEEEVLGHIHISSKDYTVRQAMEDYLETLKRDGKKCHKNWSYKINAHIIPTLGDIKVSRLSRDKIDAWKLAMVEKPRRQTFRTTGNRSMVREVNVDYETLTEDQQRKRKGTANHLLEILKSGLNLAVDSGKAEPPSKGGWNKSKLYVGTTVEKVMFLKPEEQKKLMASCPTPEFRNLVIAALLTGGRYSEIAKLTVQDFFIENRSIYFGPFGKIAGHQRHVFLIEEGVNFFKKMIEGKGSNDLIFTRPIIRFQPTSTKRPISEKWLPGDHVYYMNLATKTAEINNFTFHGLRHIYASVLVHKGVPLVYVANQLGHTTIKLVEKTYGHLMPTDISETIRAALPNILT